LILSSCVRAGATDAKAVVGIALTDTTGAWCAEFPSDSAVNVSEGETATIIFAVSDGTVARKVRIGAARSAQCGTAFPQPRWESYSSFDLAALDSAVTSAVGLIVIGEVGVARAAGIARADIDGDGISETIRRCAADEGEHFTVWSGNPRKRRWHEYFDWGAVVDRTCRDGEDGRDDPR
jgi:hypothetical protein